MICGSIFPSSLRLAKRNLKWGKFGRGSHPTRSCSSFVQYGTMRFRAPFPRRKPRDIESVPSLRPSDESTSSNLDSPSDEEDESHTVATTVSPEVRAMLHNSFGGSSPSRGLNPIKTSEGEPVWKKRLRQSRSDKLTIEGRAWSQNSPYSAARRATSGTIRDAPSDEVVSVSSFQALPPNRSLSNVSGVSSTMSDIFQSVSEQDTFSVDTPQSYRRRNRSLRFVESSAEASDSETTSISSDSGRARRTDDPEADCSRRFRGCLGVESNVSVGVIHVFLELVLRDFGVLCGTGSSGTSRRRRGSQTRKLKSRVNP